MSSALSWSVTTVRGARADSVIWGGERAQNALRPIDKMVLEAALLALVAGRAPAVRPAAQLLIEAVAEHDEVIARIFDLLRWRPHLRTSLGLLWVALDEFGCGDRGRSRALAELWGEERAPTQPHERSPYRLLDQAWVCSQATGQMHPAIAEGALLPFTSLAHLDGAPFMRRDDLYALTHAAMYVTDFGRWSPPATYPSEVIGALGLARLLEGDLDLATELAIADLLVGDTVVGDCQVVLRAVLNDVFDALGCLPSPTFDSAEQGTAADRDDYLRFHSYHTTFVYALMCSCIVSDPHATRGEPALSTPGLRNAPPPQGDASSDGHAELGRRVAEQAAEWASACSMRGVDFLDSGGALLRPVIDAHLIWAVQADRMEDVMRLLGMSSVAGRSRIDQSVRRYVDQRARLRAVELKHRGTA